MVKSECVDHLPVPSSPVAARGRPSTSGGGQSAKASEGFNMEPGRLRQGLFGCSWPLQISNLRHSWPGQTM